MSVSEHLKQWERQMEHVLLGFFVRLGEREIPESWQAEWPGGETRRVAEKGEPGTRPH